ncbi:TAP-like protein-domain-containing protein [Gymnopilus junonius]|uniref:TAP-like protein-domain-containing protein n=1 Tax=Gymnopilus junonius TaxID=109634 RepID=A0A9P5NQT7_GYMJU|nr:TAP-like protein-domain-containing protein [Gymnopilus junonius]
MHPRARVPYLLLALSSSILFSVLLLLAPTLEGSPLSNGPSLSAYSTSFSGSFPWETLPPSRNLEWVKCYQRHECARLLVPLNYSDPNGPEAAIALIRKPSEFEAGSEYYRGPVLFNPGGPGESGVDTVLRGGDLLGKIIGPQFDVVGFDPRGVSRSTPHATFFRTEVERELWGWNTDAIVNNTGAGITPPGNAEHSQGSWKVKATILGFLTRYGSILGATFAAMFPNNVERLVIDGVADSEDYYATLWSNNLLDTDKALETFFAGCAEAGPEGCAFWAPTPEDIKQNLTVLYDSLRHRPIPIKTGNNYGVLEYGFLKAIVFNALYSPWATYPFLAQAIAKLAVGDGSMLFETAIPPPYQCSCGSSEEAYNNIREAQIAIMCNDGDDIPEDLKSSQEYFDKLAESSSWAELWARIRLDCVGWPKFPKAHFQGPFVANTSHPILLIGNTADPVTPLWAAKKMSKGFNNSVVLTQDSPGHSSVAAPSLCTQTYIRNYFIHGTLPEPGTVCETIGKPFPEVSISADLLMASEEYSSQKALMASMTEGERDLFAAISELSRKPIISMPFQPV